MLRASPFGVLLLLTFGACASSTTPAQAPASADHEASSSSDASNDEAPNDESASEEAPKKADACADGTCSPCGSGICLSGWYCDESAAGGPACGWLPACAQKTSCACLAAQLGTACKCSEQAGGLHVTCK